MLFYRKVYITLLLACFVFVDAKDQHLNVNSPFGKRHSVNNEPSPYACHRGPGISSSSN